MSPIVDQDAEGEEEAVAPLNWGDGFHDPSTCKACLHGKDFMHGKLRPDGQPRGLDQLSQWKHFLSSSKSVVREIDRSDEVVRTKPNRGRAKVDKLTLAMFQESQGDQN